MVTKSRGLRDEADEGAPALAMTPMIDIVFQLLIFFMLACRFRTTEGEIKTNLPRIYGQDITSPGPISINKLRIKLLWCEPGSNRETQHPTNGRAVLKVESRVMPNTINDFGESEPDWSRLYALICEARNNYPPTRAHPTLPAIIDARRHIPFKHVVGALNECIRANLKEIEFAKPQIPY